MKLALLAALAMFAQAAPRAVILTTDCGADMDDQWALAQLALAPEIRLLGVVTTHAPDLRKPASESSARAAKEVLAKLSLPAPPPVFAGSSEPLAGRYSARRNEGVDFILAESRKHPDLAVLVIGAATDLASALLLDPGLSRRIEVAAMGFDGWPAGGDPYNVKNDIAAWQVLMESGVPLAVGDVAVTKKHLAIGRAQAIELLGGRGAAGAYLAAVQNTFIDKHPDLTVKYTGRKDAWPVWDSVTVAYLLGMTKWDEHSRPGLRNDMTLLHTEPCVRNCRRSPTIRWITSIDEKALWSHFTSHLDRIAAR